MAEFSRPTLSAIIDRMQSDINAALPGADSRVRRSVLSVLSRTLAGAVHGLYGYLSFISRQILPDTAEAEYLARQAAIWGITRKPATQATGTATLTGNNGATLAAGSVLQRADGAEYTTDASATVSGGSLTVAITAKVAGLAGNASASTALSLTQPVSGINSQGTSGSITGGADIETDDSLRARLIARLQSPPQGGNAADYVAWALAVPGVTRAWVYPVELGAGTVTVRFMMDGTYADGIPLAGDVAAVQAYIDPLRPVTATVTAVAPVATPLDMTIDLRGGASGDTAEIRAAVTAELRDLLLRDAVPGGTILLSRLREAVSIAAGEIDNAITSPTADVTRTTGQITTLGAITWA